MAAVSLVGKNISQFGHFKSQRQIYLLNKLELTQCNGEGGGLELTSLRSKRFQSSYSRKLLRAEATSRGNACYAGYELTGDQTFFFSRADEARGT